MQRNRHTIFQHPARTEAEAEALDGFGREAEASNEKQAEIDRVKGELAKVKAKIDRLIPPLPTARLRWTNSRK